MLSRFFIDRPIFATVLSVVITLIGGAALAYLPVAQYPRITPPGVVVAITYPGASARVVADTVAAPVEQQVTGVPGMLYMSSLSGNDGSYQLTCTFNVGTNLDAALVMVQNRIALAMPLLPTPVQQQGITIRKRTPDILLMVNFTSPGGRYNDVYLSNFVLVNVRDELLRTEGVSDVNVMGQRDYSIRIWLDPQKIASRNMTVGDVANAIRQQSVEAALGQVGQAPMRSTQGFQFPVDTFGRLRDPEQFGDVVVKVRSRRPVQAGGAGSSGTGLPSSGITDPLLAALAQNPTTSMAQSASRSTTTTTTSTTTPTPVTPDMLAPITGLPGQRGGGVALTTGPASPSSSQTTGGATTAGAAAGSPEATMPAMLPSSLTAGGASMDDNGAISATSPDSGPGAPTTAIVRLRDVARVELGALNYNQAIFFDGKPSVGLAVYQLPETNALEVADRVRARMKELSTRFPEDVEWTIGYDTTPFISESIDEVYKTLRDAVILVALVVLFFLQDWKAMILPMIDVPVSLIGTFAVMSLLGYSLNNISLFGLVLAIGIVVDDAIVVLENIERQMAKGYDPRTATIKAMDEITGPILAITLVLCAVFVPCAFISGITGRFFQQFAVTIAASTVISAINALTMTPSRALLILKGGGLGHGHKREALPWWFFGLLGGWLCYSYGPALLAEPLGLPVPPQKGTDAPAWLWWVVASAWFTAGMVPGLVVGKVIIRPVNVVLGWVFRAFNRLFDLLTGAYDWSIGMVLRLTVLTLLAYGGMLAATWWLFATAPTGFVPAQDMGRCLAGVQLPNSASLARTKEAMLQIEKIARETPGVRHTIAICGTSFVQQSNGSNFGSLFIVLEPFSERQKPELKDEAIMARLRERWRSEVPDAQAVVFGAPPIPGISVAGGFKVIVEDRGGLGPGELQEQTDRLIKKMRPPTREEIERWIDQLGDDNENVRKGAAKELLDVGRPALEHLYKAAKHHPNVVVRQRALDLATVIAKADPVRASGVLGVSTQFRSGIPQLYLDVDWDKVAALGLSPTDVNQALTTYVGSTYVNTFNDFGRHWQVTLQADGDFRSNVANLNLIQIRNRWGQMVPLGTIVKAREITGPIFINRYNLYTAAAVTGSLRPGVSSGDVIAEVDAKARETLPRSMRADWTELMYLQILEGSKTPPYVIFSLAVLFVFLALAALYESWTLPMAVILVVPLCVLCSVGGAMYANMSLNIFVQIGMVVLVGLACKNSILIVEFAREKHEAGMPVREATREASRLRLRPILMTSFAFILGVVPLMYASGAGAEMRRSLGVAVFSGMLGVTLFGVFLTPVFFYVIQGFGETKLMSGPTTRLVTSCVLGSALGAAGGYLLGRMEVVPMVWSIPVGTCAGPLGVLAVVGIHKQLRPTERRT